MSVHSLNSLTKNGYRLRSGHRETSTDGNTTTSTLSFSATKDDAGTYLACKAENKAVSSEGLEDGWKLEIQCPLQLRKVDADGNAANWRQIKWLHFEKKQPELLYNTLF
uniref:Ig-like domain-containing protein n=1 Tax=Timema douglasi TaxID=61478 RepID=A0A7R8VBT5_TIMDO|nr:unnamed protein product [Timema douglasi]